MRETFPLAMPGSVFSVHVLPSLLGLFVEEFTKTTDAGQLHFIRRGMHTKIFGKQLHS